MNGINIGIGVGLRYSTPIGEIKAAKQPAGFLLTESRNEIITESSLGIITENTQTSQTFNLEEYDRRRN